MILFSIPNLSSSAATRVDVTEAPVVARPQFKDKESYRRWCSSKDTDHAFLSAAEGMQPGVRVSASNPPAQVHGLVGEFDAELPPDWLERLGKAAIRPEWACRTFSGNGRAYWPFESPLTFCNRKLHDHFCAIAWAEINANRLLPGFDTGESSDPAKYFEVGTDWSRVGDALPAALVNGWVARACAKVDWSKEGPRVPLDKLREECARRWPSRWPGGWEQLAFGARGVRFWADGDAQSVLATEAGCVCFTGDTPFMSWSAILGADWVRRATDSTLGEAIDGIYYDAGTSKYASNGSTVGWLLLGVEDCRRRLAERGLSTTCPKGQTISEADRALLAIQKTRSVDGCFAAFFRPEEVVAVNQRRFLNTSRLSLFAPHPEPHPDPDGCSWLMEFLDLLFDDQLPYYIAWLAHYYRSCLAGRPIRGLSLFIAGPPNCGKTFLNNAIHRQIFGAAGEATRFLTGEDQFNSGLFACPIWTVDDAVASTDARTSSRFSQVVKAITANDEFVMRGMYREGVRMPWTGRLIVTMNGDPESLRLMPSTELSLMDKIMLLKGNSTFSDFPSDESVAEELPHFCAYLRDLTKDPSIWVGGRFGIMPYHQPELLDAAIQSQDTTAALNLIERWAAHYFSQEGAGADREEWAGTPTDLLAEFNTVEAIKDLAGRLTPNAVHMGRYLNKIINRGAKDVTLKRAPGTGRRLYHIRKGLGNEPACDSAPQNADHCHTT